MDQCYDEIKELAILKSAVENTNEAFVTINENHTGMRWLAMILILS